MSLFNLNSALVLGAGESGIAAAKLLRAGGLEVTVYDQMRPEEARGAQERLQGLGAKWVLGPDAPHPGYFFDLWIVSPGVPLTAMGAPEAFRSQIPVLGELELAARVVNLPVVAVTGTNGKTTVAGLAAHILAQVGRRPFLGGNIGNPYANCALELQADPGRYDCAVLEVSSFQLETVSKFRAKGAAILNVTPDHLDRHGDFLSYFHGKWRIFQNQDATDWAILNDDEYLLVHKSHKARRFGFSLKEAPAHGGYVHRKGAKETLKIIVDGKEAASVPWEEFALKGRHNQGNVLAAVGLALSLGADPRKALEAARDFSVDDHRLQLIGEFDGVSYYDDSKATNPGATIAALDNFKDKSVVLIAGGRDKGLDYGALLAPVTAKARHLILLGEAARTIARDLQGFAPITFVPSMRDAAVLASVVAKKGDVALLSPACASFDMFANYKERGLAFQKEVRRVFANPESRAGAEPEGRAAAPRPAAPKKRRASAARGGEKG
ncbi:MAG: UDP-N-acetylmuramoyl-L-alanine--D-glutamate ligase [Deltaproteobacteria bacterium]|jgi:UDP-N-acetylmuramoylalanine--D-glutamate ligase|nr:UDP-N-acetylmuramoyl-L-alanine--D-glutamate ligase [Deltaproteobacteria bacterium]